MTLRFRFSSWLLLVLGLGLAGEASASSRQAKQEERRREAEGLLQALVMGGEVGAGIARVKFLGEERFAARVLEEYARAPEERYRRVAAEALAGLAVPESEPALAKLAADPDGSTRMSAVRGLRFLHSQNLRVLLPRLQDDTLGVRREAALALGAARRPEAGVFLIRAAQSEPEPEVRALMVVAAGQSGDGRQAAALAGFLRSSSESTRAAAARGLCLLGSPVGFGVVRMLLASADRDQRRAGVSMLEGVPAQRAEPLLLPLLRDPDPGTAARTARLLLQAGDRSMLDWLVLAADRARGEDKLLYENELDAMHLTDEQRQDILQKAGPR